MKKPSYKSKVCTRCRKEFKPTSGYQAYCGPLRVRGSCAYIRNLERARQNNGGRYLAVRFHILQKYKFTCQYCGRKAPNVTLHVDHIIPKSKGGLNTMNNYTVACEECNLGKRDVLLA